MAAPGSYGRPSSSYGSSMTRQLAQRTMRRTQRAQIKPQGTQRAELMQHRQNAGGGQGVAFPASLLNSEPKPNRASITRHYQSMLGQMSGMTRRGRPLR